MMVGRELLFFIPLYLTFFGVLFFKNASATGFPMCSEYDFPCENGECIDSALWCDSFKDCSDETDEKYCKESSWGNRDPNACSLISSAYFRCKNGPCIPLVGRCDGQINCEDNSDEEECEHYSTTKSASALSYINESDRFNAIEFFVSLDSTKIPLKIQILQELPTSSFKNQQNLARNWLLSQRRSDFGWGDETHRAITALCLSDEPPVMRNTDGYMLMIKQLEIQLLIELLRNRVKPMKLPELALFINALLSSCNDPKNFYGEDLVLALRQRVNAAQMKDRFINPSVYLTLCINNATTYNDTTDLHDIFFNGNTSNYHIDIQALAFMTTSCIFRKTNFLNATLYDNIQMEFLRTVKKHGFQGNIYEAALLMQALQEMKVTLLGLMNFILQHQQENGSFGDFLSTYLVLPILTGKNIIRMDYHCGHRKITDMAPTQVLKIYKSRKIRIHLSLNYGFPTEIKQSIQMYVPDNTTFLDTMRLAQEIDPKFRFQLEKNAELPIIYSIDHTSNDAEKGMYWVLYKVSRNSSEIDNENYRSPYSGDITQLVLTDGDKMLFWYRPLQK